MAFDTDTIDFPAAATIVLDLGHAVDHGGTDVAIGNQGQFFEFERRMLDICLLRCVWSLYAPSRLDCQAVRGKILSGAFLSAHSRPANSSN